MGYYTVNAPLLVYERERGYFTGDRGWTGMTDCNRFITSFRGKCVFKRTSISLINSLPEKADPTFHSLSVTQVFENMLELGLEVSDTSHNSI